MTIILILRENISEIIGQNKDMQCQLEQEYRPTSMGRKQKDPKPFDGHKIEWCDYLKHFEAVSSWNGWDDNLRAHQLVMSL